MPEMLLHAYSNEKTDLEETSLTEQLVDVFKRKFSDSKQLHVLGILSYSSDGHDEKFVKIDFSSPPLSNDESESSFTKDNHLNVTSSPSHININSNVSSSTTSPAIIDSYSASGVVSDLCLADKPFKMDDEYGDNLNDVSRRDRRKCRHPKRQLVESSDTVSRSNESSCKQNRVNKIDVNKGVSENAQAIKIPRLDSSLFNFSSIIEVPQVDPYNRSDIKCSTCTSPSNALHSQPSICSTVNSVPIFSLSTAAPSKHLPEVITIGEVLGSVSNSTNNKCSFAAKTVNINDLGELCNLLPLSALVNRTVNPSNDTSSVKVSSSNPTICTPTDQKECYPSIAQNASSSILLNPNLAATLTAALSGSVVTPNNDDTSTKHSVGFSSPTITFTGASGEIIGAIPIASATTNAMVTPVLPSVTSIPTVTGNTLNSPLTSNSYTTAASNLASVINSLRSATSLDCQNQQPVNIAISGAYNPSMVSSSPITLLQSISGNAQKPSISIGPTLALIGFNSPATPTSAVHENSTVNIGVNSVGSTLLTTQLGQNVSNNNAALVAAALLRGLVNVKQTVQESPEHSQNQSTDSNLTNPLTVLTNNTSSTPQMRPVYASDASISTPNAVLPSKAIHSNGIPIGTVSDATPSFLASSAVSTAHNNRSSIMLSYPRASSDMNFLLSPGSVAPHAFNPTISTLNAVPGTFSLQALSNSGPSGITLTSPLLFHSNTISALPTTNSVVTTTCTISVPTPVASTKQEACVGGMKNTDLSNFHVAIKPDTNEKKTGNRILDPTTSAIDRILQTIKGCMNTTENRENDQKSKSSKKAETSSTVIVSASNHSEVSHTLVSSSSKIQPMTLCLSKTSAGVVNSEISSKTSKSSLLNGDRLPLPPLNKESTDTDNQTSTISKVYRCRYCGKTFNRKFCRERHERLHTGVKPYTCEICDEKFIRLEDKKRHVRSLQHILVGRESTLKSESTFSCGETSSNTVEPSCVLPLLAHTLRGRENETAEESVAKGDDSADVAAASDINSNEHESDCESSDTDVSNEREVAELIISDVVLSKSISSSNSPITDVMPASHAFDDSPNLSSLPTSEKVVSSALNKQDGNRTPTSHNLRIRCRSALKETQPESNNASHHHVDSVNRTFSLVLTKEGIKTTRTS